GRPYRITLGRYPCLSLEEARAKARPLINDAYNGIDIVAWKKKEKLASVSLQEAVNRYLEYNFEEGRYWSETRDRLFSKLLKPLGPNTRIGEIEKEDLKLLINGDLNLFKSVRPLWRWMKEEDLIELNPFESIPSPRHYRARDRILSDNEI